VVVGHNPAAIADVLMTLLARVIACNSRNPAMMGAALARNLALALEDDEMALMTRPFSFAELVELGLFGHFPFPSSDRPRLQALRGSV
jgi:hypothetical protein